MSFALLTVLLLAPMHGSPTDDELMQQAETAFADGIQRREAGEKSWAQFRKAVAAYEELRRRGASNAFLFRNLGNARLLAGDRPGAILAYREGLRIAPESRVLGVCLATVRKEVAFPEGSRLGRAPEDLRPPWLLAIRAGWMFAFAVAAYAVGCAVLTRWLMLRRRALLLGGLCLLALAVGVGVLLWQRQRAEQDQPIVVLARNGVLLRKGNGRLFPPRYETPLNQGVEARLLYRRDDWLQIELSGGEIGWVAASDALVEE